MTNVEIINILENRGYILESDCANAPMLTYGEMETYNRENNFSIIFNKEDNNYALYNISKFDKNKIINRMKYKKKIATYLCNKAKNRELVRYTDFNKFLKKFELDYFKDNDIKFLVEEISTDFESITNKAVLTAVLVKKNNLPSDGFWTLAGVIGRKGDKTQEIFHNTELDLLQNSLKHYNC